MSETPSSHARLQETMSHVMTRFRVPLMLLAGFVVIAFIHEPKAILYGTPVALFGELVQMWAASHLKKQQHLAVSGPYSYVRNPMYIGRFFLGLGFLMMTWRIELVVIYVLAFAYYAHFRVKGEEERLHEIFKDYADYCAEINRWIPKLKPYSRAEKRKASWHQLCVNHEQLNLIGLIVVVAAVYVRAEQIPWHW